MPDNGVASDSPSESRKNNATNVLDAGGCCNQNLSIDGNFILGIGIDLRDLQCVRIARTSCQAASLFHLYDETKITFRVCTGLGSGA